MDGGQEYEVESVTRARVHDKKGKKITWKYYVKWKGYDWDESTWEPTDSFQGGSEHILESFWERIDTSGRDISDATAFKKGEELFISGPPGKRGPKRKGNPTKSQMLPSKGVPSSNGVTVSAPLLTTRKRRHAQISADDGWRYSKPRRRVSTADLKNGGSSTPGRPPKRRRASSPGTRKSAPKRMSSPGDSQLDADGETDPDVVEVEDELMQVSAEDPEEGNARTRHPVPTSGNADGSKKISFDDLEHFYSGNPIDIDQHTDEQVADQKPESRPRVSPSPATVVSPDKATPASEVPASPALSSSDPLFGSPQLPSEVSETQRDSPLPLHRTRAVNPRIKLIDTTTAETSGKQSRITAKARLMSTQATDPPSTSGPSHAVAKQGGKPGPARSFAGLVIKKNRSSLLTATKGTLKSVKGKFVGTATERDQPDEIEEAPGAGGRTVEAKLLITSWSDEDVAVDTDHQVASISQQGPPSGEELLKLAGLQTEIETLPDYEDDPAAQPQDVETQGPSLTTSDLPKSSVEVTEESKASSHIVDTPLSVAEEQRTPIPPTTDPSIPPVVPSPADEAVKMNIELAKEHLFPSTQTSFDSFSAAHSSFRSTIFGPLYQGLTVNHVPVTKNDPSTTFKVILRDGVELPLALKDCNEIKARISDILIGNSSGSKVALFYSAEDALAMVSALKGDGTARVVLDPATATVQQECFSMFLQRFESSQTLVAPVGKEVCVLYSSENAHIAEKLEAPAHLRGLSSTLLISHASIENQLAYVAAIMKATVL